MKINVIDDKGAERLVNIITAFKLSGKKYVIYSFFEKDSSGSIRIYISELRIKQDSFSFNNIINANEWEDVKKLMKEFAKGVTNLDYVLSNFDVDIVPIKNVMENNEYILATIKDSKVVKVSSKFIEGLVGTYKELVGRLSITTVAKESVISAATKNEETKEEQIEKDDNEKIADDSTDDVSEEEILHKEEETKKKMKDIWEYSSMLQKKIAKDMKELNSKVVKLDDKKYYVDVKDPLYLKEKIELQIPDNKVLKELEPEKNEIKKSDEESIFSQLEKELSGINDNFNKIVEKNQKEKEKIASEIEKRLQDVAMKERKLTELEERLNNKEEELRIREEELLKANQRLEEDVRSLTKYASMINSIIKEEGK